MKPDDINALIDECITNLCDDNAELGASSLVEFANVWAKSGLGRRSFENMRLYIIRSAIERLGTAATSFIHYKLQVAESELRKGRNKSAHSNIIVY